MLIEIISFYARIVQMILFLLIQKLSSQQPSATYEIKKKIMSHEFNDEFAQVHKEIYKAHLLQSHTEAQFDRKFGTMKFGYKSKKNKRLKKEA